MIVPKRIRSSTVSGIGGELADGEDRADQASGGMMALTREPSGRRASTIGLDSSMRRPTGETMRSMIRITWSSSWNVDVGQLELALALDVDLLGPVDHDFGDALVAQQRLERAEADDLVGDLLEHADALGARQGEAFLVDGLAEDLLDLPADLDLVAQVELGIEVRR